jgi:hypothetical protein
LYRTVVKESLLQRAEFVGPESFDRIDLGLVRLSGKHQTGIDDAAADRNGARAALAYGAAFFRTV